MNQKTFFFFKQKTAYEIPLRLVGSEMCIRDRTLDPYFGGVSALSWLGAGADLSLIHI